MGPGRLLTAGGTMTDVYMCVLPAYPQDHCDGGTIATGMPFGALPWAYASGTPGVHHTQDAIPRRLNQTARPEPHLFPGFQSLSSVRHCSPALVRCPPE